MTLSMTHTWPTPTSCPPHRPTLVHFFLEGRFLPSIEKKTQHNKSVLVTCLFVSIEKCDAISMGEAKQNFPFWIFLGGVFFWQNVQFYQKKNFKTHPPLGVFWWCYPLGLGTAGLDPHSTDPSKTRKKISETSLGGHSHTCIRIHIIISHIHSVYLYTYIYIYLVSTEQHSISQKKNIYGRFRK